MDAFNGYDLKNRSTTSVSMSISNIRSKYKYDKKYIQTLMLLPPYVDLYEALAPVRRDLAELERGIMVSVHPDAHGEVKVIRVVGAASILLGDHVQACENCSHLGNHANLNCRSCLMNKAERFEFGPRILNFDMTRNSFQRSAILVQVARQSGPFPSANRLRELRTMYGISTGPLPFGDLLDPYLQSFHCVGHAVDLGLMSRLIAYGISRLNPASLNVLVARMSNMEYPRSWKRLPAFKSKLVGRLGQPMVVTKKLGLSGYYLFTGLIPNDLLALINELLEVRAHIMRLNHTDATIARVGILMFLLFSINYSITLTHPLTFRPRSW